LKVTIIPCCFAKEVATDICAVVLVGPNKRQTKDGNKTEHDIPV
jgi:hypothetical protein